MKRVLFISSCGGHLTELLELKEMFSHYDYQIVTEKTKSNQNLKEKYPGRVHFLIYGTKHHPISYPFKLLANCFISLFYFFKYRPQFIVTTGAHTAGPMCCIAKLFRRKVIYIETFANAHSKSVTGKLLYHIADLFIVQWKSMLEVYPKATYGGWIF